MSETWLKNHHSTELYHIDDYICYRRDRQRRRGGGVAIFAKADMKSELFIPPGDRDEFEILWIKVNTGSNHYVGALYHPPKPVYCVSDLVSFIESTLDYIMASDVGTSPPLISLSGDFNQLNHMDILSLGLLPALYAPTHKGHNLDRIYVSQPAYSNAKVVQSTIVTEHRAVVARDDNNCIVDFNKKTNTATIRLRTPRQHAAVLSHLQTYSWDSVCSATEVQQAADLFYDQMKTIVDVYYPLSTITTTSRDPGFVTPEVKSMLRKKNYLMRRGRIEEANSIVKRVSKIIIEHNSVCFKGLNSRVDTRELWSNVNKVLGKTRKISNILVDSKICAESLNTHYANLSTDANYVVSCTKLTAYDCDNDDFMDEMTYVFHMLDKLKPTAAGTDDLPYWILKLTACSIAKPIAHIYNLSILSSLQPSQWKQAIITPIPKILHQFLPSLKPTPYSFRPRSHSFYLPDKKNSLINKNFINRVLYKDIFQ